VHERLGLGLVQEQQARRDLGGDAEPVLPRDDGPVAAEEAVVEAAV
jgi:hypothetical protein